jgi:hypothetical protein
MESEVEREFPPLPEPREFKVNGIPNDPLPIADDGILPPAVTDRLIEAQLGLEAKGYSEELSSIAIRRIAREAEAIANNVRPEIREAVWEDTFEHRLATAPEWIDNYKRGIEK